MQSYIIFPTFPSIPDLYNAPPPSRVHRGKPFRLAGRLRRGLEEERRLGLIGSLFKVQYTLAICQIECDRMASRLLFHIWTFGYMRKIGQYIFAIHAVIILIRCFG